MPKENSQYKFTSLLSKNAIALAFVSVFCFVYLFNSYKAINNQCSKIVRISESQIQQENVLQEHIHEINPELNNAFMNAVEVNSAYKDTKSNLELA